MPLNGSGVWTPPAANFPAVANTLAQAADYNAVWNDAATAISTAIMKDGQTTITADIPFATNKITGLGDGTLIQDAMTLNNFIGQTGVYVGTVGGTADVITLTPSPAISAYAAGQTFIWAASGANTTNVTVNVSGVGAAALTKNGATALVADDIPSGALIRATYDGTRFVINNLIPITSAERNQSFNQGRCRLTFSTPNLLLSPYNGNEVVVKISGVWTSRTIGSAGITLAPTSNLADTTYYIYLFDSSGTLTLEFSTTAPATDADRGYQIQTGDASRLLVGMARSGSSAATWLGETLTTLSWFNQRQLTTISAKTTDTSIVSTTFAEISTDYRTDFLTWGSLAVDVRAHGFVSNDTINASCISSLGIDDATDEDVYSRGQSGAANLNLPLALNLTLTSLSEGFHDARLLGRVTAGSGTWHGAASGTERTTVQVTVWG